MDSLSCPRNISSSPLLYPCFGGINASPSSLNGLSNRPSERPYTFIKPSWPLNKVAMYDTKEK